MAMLQPDASQSSPWSYRMFMKKFVFLSKFLCFQRAYILLTDLLPVTYSKDRIDVEHYIQHDGMPHILLSRSYYWHYGFAVHVSFKILVFSFLHHYVLAQYSRNIGIYSVQQNCSCIRCLSMKDNIFVLHEVVTRNRFRMQCAQITSNMSIEQCKKLHLKNKTKHGCIKRNEIQSVIDRHFFQASLYAIMAFLYAKVLI